jgi:hypothetical protein
VNNPRPWARPLRSILPETLVKSYRYSVAHNSPRRPKNGTGDRKGLGGLKYPI